MSNEELVEQIRNGYSVTDNLQKLFENNMPLIKRFAALYMACADKQGILQAEDIFQSAFIGLYEAVMHYEADKGVLFMTFARFWIVRAVQQYVENCSSVVHFSAGHRQRIAQYKMYLWEFEQESGRLPADWEVERDLGFSPEEVNRIKISVLPSVSLDSPLSVAEEDELTMGDTVAAPYSLEDAVIEQIFNERQKTEIWSLVASYTDKQQEQVIREHYKENKPLTQIAKESGVSLSKVRQHQAAGLRRLRTGKALQELKEKLEIVEASVYRSGFRGFKEHGDSIVEHIALRRAELEQKYKKAMSV